MRDRTGELIDEPAPPEDPKAAIRRLLCDANCDHDQHPADPTLLDP